jgi:hypothetical protein
MEREDALEQRTTETTVTRSPVSKPHRKEATSIAKKQRGK